MLEMTGDLWQVPGDVRVITTNGTIKQTGELVMGRGVALQAKRKYPRLPYLLGQLVLSEGNHVHLIKMPEEYLVSYPVKHNWFEPADIELIERSAQELAALTNQHRWTRVLLVRPGCGNGGLTWKQVEPVIRPFLDNRFIIVSKPEGDLDEF